MFVRLTTASTALGVVMGVAWWALTPPTRLQKRSTGVFVVDQARETAVAADGWFAVCALTAGVLVGFLVAVLGRGDRLAQLLGITAGGLLGSLVAWRVGVALGPDAVADQVRSLRTGARFQGPLRLSALGVLMMWPTSAVIVFFAAVAGLDSSRHERPRTESPVTSAAEQSSPR